ncbi:MAG: hypothetical protein JWQ63_2329 [Mucilaginibacter sp.]|nr:hypothetical protein [Mucilaginibacter sp.]
MKSDMENKDWLNDYKLLKQINPDNPFTVPAGYFDDLGDRIVSYKNLDDLKNGSFGGFTVPPNYFEELPGNIQSRIAIESSLGLKNTGFTVPDGYFDDLEQQIKSRILVEKALGNPDEHFTVPQGYFNQLNKNILDNTVNFNNVNRKGIIRRMFASTAFKYATAACFALALGSGILLSELNNSASQHKNSFLHKELSNVPVDEIKNYLQLNVDAGETQQTVAADGVPVDANSLKNALQNNADSVQ